MTQWVKKLKHDPTQWLLESNPWTRYRTLTDLMDEPDSAADVKKARKQCLENDLVKGLVQQTLNWMPLAATRNNDPKISYFTLRMLSDFGYTASDSAMKDIYKKATAHVADNLFACRGQIPEKPKKGEKYVKPDLAADMWHVSPCNSPVITYSLLAMGYETPEVMQSVERLKELWSDEIGWFCHFFFVQGQFKRENAGCPIAGLMALEVFSRIESLRESVYARNAFAPVKYHKDLGKSIYYFGRSKKFWTLKYPFVWYNALYMADVLSRFSFLSQSPVLGECIEWILNSQDERGRFKPTSIFVPYRGWDFGNKKQPSPWITFLCCRILKRYFG